ncbi:hypothetical protein PR048_016285 [Dryococelus australis]|uniref:Uncharacterized protein n=1 Tax=Dryococelus australis TaxID=614101 RepID=A0ABQ9HJB1_9NEOP|nr:hypothetical protein PR048_016285 [Dryococelus australis]
MRVIEVNMEGRGKLEIPEKTRRPTTSSHLRKSDWDRHGHERVHRQLSVSSDSKLLDEDIREEARVILRPKKPPRPKSEVFLNKEQQRRTKRYSAFGVNRVRLPQNISNQAESKVSLGSQPRRDGEWRGEIWEALDIGVSRADEGETRRVWSSAGMQWWGELEIPELTP